MHMMIPCPRCNGTGSVPSKRQNGICFECTGAKQLRVSPQVYNSWKKKKEKKMQQK